MTLLNDLNQSQQQAVIQTDGPSLVIAGAGSGKTRVLTYKIAYLLEQGAKAYNILALTFTNKAAREMRERIYKLVGESKARQLWMGTFHSICAKILRREAAAIGFTPDYTIYDTTDSKNLLKHIVKDMGLDEKVYKPADILSRISSAKNNLYTPHDYANDNNIIKRDQYNRVPRTADIFYEYNRRLKLCNAMDFDDLLFNSFRLLNDSAQARNKYQQQFQYVLVDEYQDTNFVQYKIVSLLAAPQNNICVVGDDAQSIYAFRGADINNILHFQDLYANSKLFKLERNYRSTQNIVNLANSLIRRNADQIKKDIYSEKEEGAKAVLTQLFDDRAEAKNIVDNIGKLKQQYSSYDSFAILYRTNAQSRVIEDELRKQDIPYRIYGSVSFYQRKEIKDALAYIRLTVNHQDNESLLRIINTPARGIGETTMNKVSQAARDNDVAIFEVVRRPAQFNVGISNATISKLMSFAQMIESMQDKQQTLDAFAYAKEVIQKSTMLANAIADNSQEGIDRQENLQELLGSINEFVEERKRNQEIENATIAEFLQDVSLMTDQDENINDPTPRVSLMTVHAAKGLEFPVVFIAGMEEQLFPSQFAQSRQEIEEERRLFYVAITRAEEQLFISNARQRFKNGAVAISAVSRFVNELDPHYLTKVATNSNSYWNDNWMSNLKKDFDLPYYHKPATAPTPSTSLKQIGTRTVSDTTDRRQVKTNYPIGSTVQHKTFGIGKVLSAYEENGNEKIEILFQQHGKKTLLLKFAVLTLVAP